MRKQDLVKYKDKKIKITLKDGFYYTGFIIKISDEILELKDKFGNFLTIDLNMISTVVEVQR